MSNGEAINEQQFIFFRAVGFHALYWAMKRLTLIELLVYHSENWFAAGPDDSWAALSYGWNVLTFADFSGVDCGWTCWEPDPNIVKQSKFENPSETMTRWIWTVLTRERLPSRRRGRRSASPGRTLIQEIGGMRQTPRRGIKWWAVMDSNHRPPGCKPDALAN